jgi:hypothetical protein
MICVYYYVRVADAHIIVLIKNLLLVDIVEYKVLMVRIVAGAYYESLTELILKSVFIMKPENPEVFPHAALPAWQPSMRFDDHILQEPSFHGWVIFYPRLYQ